MIVSIDVGRKNLAVCALDAGGCRSGRDDVIRHWTVTSCEPTPAGLASALRDLPWCLTCSEAVVERQPPKNATMSRLQHYIEMYFAMHDKPITVLDAKHKLAFAASTEWWPADQATSWTYHARKKLAVGTVTSFLKGTPQSTEFREVFGGSKKKDDLADCLLQAQAFAHNVLPLEAAKRDMALAVAQAAVKPRKPTAKQLSTKKYGPSQLAWFFRGVPRCQAQDVVDRHGLEPSMVSAFGGVEPALDRLGITT